MRDVSSRCSAPLARRPPTSMRVVAATPMAASMASSGKACVRPVAEEERARSPAPLAAAAAAAVAAAPVARSSADT